MRRGPDNSNGGVCQLATDGGSFEVDGLGKVWEYRDSAQNGSLVINVPAASTPVGGITILAGSKGGAHIGVQCCSSDPANPPIPGNQRSRDMRVDAWLEMLKIG